MTTRTLPNRRTTTSAVSSRFSENWRHYSSCTPSDEDLFFPDRGGPEGRQKTLAAKQLCAGCPVREQCLEWALESGQGDGVLGGLDGKERRHLLRTGLIVPDVAEEAALAGGDIDQDAVDAYVSGTVHRVEPAERLAAIAVGALRGMRFCDFDALHGLGVKATSKFVTRMRRLYAQNGLEFPEVLAIKPQGQLTEAHVLEIRRRSASGAVSDERLGVEFRLSRRMISRIVTGDAYKKFGGPLRRSVSVVGRAGVDVRPVLGQRDMEEVA